MQAWKFLFLHLNVHENSADTTVAMLTITAMCVTKANMLSQGSLSFDRVGNGRLHVLL